MATDIANPFSQAALQVPDGAEEFLARFSGTFRPQTGGESDIDKQPFRRYIDLWWVAMCLGLQEEKRTTAAKWHRFIEGNVLSSDPWRVIHLEMLGVALLGADALKDPNQIIRMANEYAATGIALLTEVMTGRSEPIWEVSKFLAGRMQAGTVDESGP